MRRIPSKSFSKSLIFVTPLFIIILAVLNSSDELSYLFVLNFVNNVAGDADVMFTPMFQPVSHDSQMGIKSVMKEYNVQNNDTEPLNISTFNLPFVNMQKLQRWKSKNSLVRGVSPRWLIPIQTNHTDSLLLVANISREKSIGLSLRAGLIPLEHDQIALSDQLLNRLGVSVGDKLELRLQISNILQGSKMIEKNKQISSKDELALNPQPVNLQLLSKQLYSSLGLKDQISQEQFNRLFNLIYSANISKTLKIAYKYQPKGLYPTVLHNVVLMDFNQFSQWLSVELYQKIILPGDQNISQRLQGQSLQSWLKLKELYNGYLLQEPLSELLQTYCLLGVSSFKERETLYHPSKPLQVEFSETLESAPDSTEVVSLYPIYKQSIGIRYYFRSVLQVFTFIACLLYFYTFTLIMKQVYEEKQIQVGIWRTLGAGGASLITIEKKMQANGSDLDEGLNIQNHKEVRRLRQHFSLKDKIVNFFQLMVQVGFLPYWFLSCTLSIILYVCFKMLIFHLVCQTLHFEVIEQEILPIFIIYVCILGFTCGLSLVHIQEIYENPLAQTVKPIKRTFDVVKIRIIRIETFGISIQTFMVAVMLIYEGLVSYYWIPYAILDKNSGLQVILFNSIFILTIVGAVMLIVVLQGLLERTFLRLLFLLSDRFQRLKTIFMKNLRSKQYKNTKISMVIALTFAFLLFFTSGIEIQIMIVKSFIERQLGSNLVYENYEAGKFNRTSIEAYLDKNSVQYSWLSKNIGEQNISISLVSHISPKELRSSFKVITSNYLNSTFYQYYYPQQYMSNYQSYHQLPNGVYDGFDSIYQYDGVYNNRSLGHYNPKDTMLLQDPNQINVPSIKYSHHSRQFNKSNAIEDNLNDDQYDLDSEQDDEDNKAWRPQKNFFLYPMAPHQQIINIAVTSTLRQRLGVIAGDKYKLLIKNHENKKGYYLRARITHSLKIGPGLDLLRSEAYISEEQAEYIYQVLGANASEGIKYEKLFITGQPEVLKGIQAQVVKLSPPRTQMFQVSFVAESFQLLEDYLTRYIVMITAIMAFLLVLFLFTYTLSKCRDEREQYKMLRAIGVTVSDIRAMVFIQILVRLVVSILNGMVFGLILSVGFSKQIEEFLMINTPPINFMVISIIAGVLILIFIATVVWATHYLTKRTVLQTSKL